MSKAQTEKFKDEIKRIVSETVGVDVKKQVAWTMFKAIMESGIDLCLKETPKKVFTVSGLGKFRINEGKGTGKRAEAFNIKMVPRPKFTFALPFLKKVFHFYGLDPDFLVPTIPISENEGSDV